MTRTHPPGGPQLPRRDRNLAEGHDPYRAGGKHADPSVCPDCGACFRDGRWSWKAGPVDAPRVSCPACRRIRDDLPGGRVHLEGAFLAEHRDEILALLRNVEEREKGEHPINRIMDVRDEADGAVQVRTTEAHLARAIGSALRDAYQGELEIDSGEELTRVAWRR